jgi:hypothetical protein
LKVESSESGTAGVLELHGDIELTAFFPLSGGDDNPSKAREIATAIRCA